MSDGRPVDGLGQLPVIVSVRVINFVLGVAGEVSGERWVYLT